MPALAVAAVSVALAIQWPAGPQRAPGRSRTLRASIQGQGPSDSEQSAVDPFAITSGEALGVVQRLWLPALQRGDVRACFESASTELRQYAGPKDRFESLLRTMPEYRALLGHSGSEVLSALQVGQNRWKCRVRVDNTVGSVPFSVAYTWELTLHDGYSVVDYDLGQCIKDTQRGYRGVIVGWDLSCKQLDDWCEAMGVDELLKGRQQPFYHVLVDGHEHTAYVAQELVEPTPLHQFGHPKFKQAFEMCAPEECEMGTWRPKRLLREQYPLVLEGWLVNRVFPDQPTVSDV